MTGPTSDVKTGSAPKISRARSISRRAWSAAWMCCTTHPPAPLSCSSCAYLTFRSNALAALGQQRVRLARGLVRSRDAAREVDRHDVAAGLDQGLPHRQEIADRGLRGGRQLGVAAQALVEAVEAVHLELALAALLPADV